MGCIGGKYDLAGRVYSGVPAPDNLPVPPYHIINGKTVAPGTYTVFIDLKAGSWTFIVSNWKAQTKYDPKNTAEIWGAYGYTADKDVVRAPMMLGALPLSVDEMSWQFSDMSDSGGKLTLMWDKTAASVAFKVGS